MVAMLIGMQQHYARTPSLLHFHTGNIRSTYFHAIDKHFCQAFLLDLLYTIYMLSFPRTFSITFAFAYHPLTLHYLPAG